MSEHPELPVPPEWTTLPEARRWIALRFPQRAANDVTLSAGGRKRSALIGGLMWEPLWEDLGLKP
ncbi:hypothetical protein [Neoroseomonas lacus]|uniref:Uncharacterized protein n=1 Tax=Neoroseomonas lacus TaxID=287609 RepID=A0A917NMA1_9PROT|nr:hypothetical protein [Neoroseomonas lacus]GGJ10727.1 hypothetical protein GCM10011320_17300 [Neoroseomonas lacus]